MTDTPQTATDNKPAKKAKVIAFANQKGGVAKTTTTLNLSAAFAEEGHTVLCIDMDPQGNLTMSQGIDPDTVQTSIYDVLVNKVPISEIIVKREIDVAVASIDLAGAELAELGLMARSGAHVRVFSDDGHCVADARLMRVRISSR